MARKSKPRKVAAGSDELAAIRADIDALDAKICALISERARSAQKVAVTKGKEGAAVDFYRPEREAQVLRAVVERNDGPLTDEEMVRLFREIMSACLAQEEPLKIGYLGPEGTFSQSAVYKHFGHSVRALPLGTIDEVFHEVESAAADFGVVPIENSTEGTVNHTLDMFLSSPLKICGEVELRIRQHLLGSMESLSQIVRVCAHPQSLAQCRTWLKEYLPGAALVEATSNAEGARRARDEAGTAAIAGDAAAEVYGLGKLVADIEDRPDNTTRLRVASPACAACQAQGQYDAHRIASVAPAQMALRVLPRRGWPCSGRARHEGAGQPASAGRSVPGARVLPEGDSLRSCQWARSRISPASLPAACGGWSRMCRASRSRSSSASLALWTPSSSHRTRTHSDHRPWRWRPHAGH
jgi:chorismate mutase/prephenate dehydratase